MTPERFAKLEAALKRRQPDLTVLTDSVHKSHNISAIVRTGDAVGLHRLHSVSPSLEIHRHHMTTGGSKRWIDLRVHANIDDALAVLRAEGWTLYVAHAADGAVDYRSVDYTERVAVGFGAELEGPSTTLIERADGLIRIPMQGMVESLNVSVAAAVILFEAQRQRQAAGLYDTCRLDPDEYAKTLFEWSHPEIARRCRARGLAYPPLSPDGELTENPFARGAPASA